MKIEAEDEEVGLRQTAIGEAARCFMQLKLCLSLEVARGWSKQLDSFSDSGFVVNTYDREGEEVVKFYIRMSVKGRDLYLGFKPTVGANVEVVHGGGRGLRMVSRTTIDDYSYRLSNIYLGDFTYSGRKVSGLLLAFEPTETIVNRQISPYKKIVGIVRRRHFGPQGLFFEIVNIG